MEASTTSTRAACGFPSSSAGPVAARRAAWTSGRSSARTTGCPTLCALTGTKIHPADFDGEEASQAWLGGEFTRSQPLFWKTSAPKSPGTIRDGRWKLHHPKSTRGERELYDIVADPGEQRNLAAEHPDTVKTLSAKLQAWQAALPKQYDKTDDDGQSGE